MQDIITLNPQEQTYLVRLLNYQRHHTHIDYSWQRIARILGVHRDTVRRLMRKLKELGYLTINRLTHTIYLKQIATDCWKFLRRGASIILPKLAPPLAPPLPREKYMDIHNRELEDILTYRDDPKDYEKWISITAHVKDEAVKQLLCRCDRQAKRALCSEADQTLFELTHRLEYLLKVVKVKNPSSFVLDQLRKVRQALSLTEEKIKQKVKKPATQKPQATDIKSIMIAMAESYAHQMKQGFAIAVREGWIELWTPDNYSTIGFVDDDLHKLEWFCDTYCLK